MRPVARRGALAAALALGLWLAAVPARAELERLEVEGVVAVGARAPSASSLRRRALDAAILRAVDSAALGVLYAADRLPPDFGSQALTRVLGPARIDYTARFRVLEDRGRRPAQLAEDPAVAEEYVVLAEVYVDLDRVRGQLRSAGLLREERSPAAAVGRVIVVIEPLGSYRTYAWLRSAALEAGRARSAVPQELSRERAVLAVETPLDPLELLRALRDAAPPGSRIDPVEMDRSRLVLRVQLPGDGAASAASDLTP